MALLILLVVVFLFVVSAAFLVVRSWGWPKAMEEIPGNLGWPIVGETFSFISEFGSPAGICSFMINRQKRFGKVFKTSVLGRLMMFMTGSDAAKILLTGKDGMVSLNLFYTGKQVLGQSSLLQTNGEAHKRLRRLIGEPLSIDGLRKYFQFINNLAVETLDEWSGRTIFVLDEASTFTLKVISNMIMSLEPKGEEQEKFRDNFKIISSCFSSLPLNVPGTAFYRGMKARKQMFEMLDSIIAKRRSGEICRQDFLDSLIIKHNKGGGDSNEEKLTDAQLKDNILTLLIAGHDTTTAALTWLIKFLGENPHVLEQLRIEHQQIKAKRNGENLSWADVNNLPYTAKVLSETLRRATILPWYSRKAAQDFEISEDMQTSIEGKNCIVTGANSGIGYATAEGLASRGATVYMVCRNKERGEAALSEIKSKTGNQNVHLEVCDLSSISEIKSFASNLTANNVPVHVLVNNAGLLEHNRITTPEGFELNFAVNVLGTYTMTESVMPLLEKAAPDSKVITVSSGGMYSVPLTNDLQFSDENFDGVKQYSLNKRVQVALTEKWAEMYSNKGIGFYSMHPGWAETPGVAKSLPSFSKSLSGKLRTSEEGADTIIWLALQPNEKLVPGAFYFDRSEAPKHLAFAATKSSHSAIGSIYDHLRSLSGLA